MAPILRFIISSGSKKKELRYLRLSETKVSHTYKMWTEVSSSVPHFIQVGLSHNPITYGCLPRVLCPVRRPVMTLDFVLLMDSNRASVAWLVPKISSWAWNSYVLSGIMGRSLIPKFTNIGLHTLESTDWNFFMSLSKAWFSLSQFSQSSQPANRFYWPYPVIDFIQVGQKCRKYGQNWVFPSK
jgi:hypothetical protein